MSIRKASPSDFGTLVPMAHAFHRACVFKDVEMDMDLARRYFDQMTTDPNKMVLMSDTGAMGMSVELSSLRWGHVLREHFFMAEKGTGGPLLDGFHAFARERGVDKTVLSLTCKDGEIPQRLHEHYVSLGYERAEVVYVRKVET